MTESCITYTVVDGYDSEGRPSKWRYATYCRDLDEGKKPSSTTVSAGSSSAVAAPAPPPGPSFVYDLANPTGEVAVADPALLEEQEQEKHQRSQLALNFGWNSGAHSIARLAPGWRGLVAFDVPDVQGARPAGVAVGLVPVSALPSPGRNGYAHLEHGLVFTSEKVKTVHRGELVREVPYADLRAQRSGGSTDQVRALLYGGFIKWLVNGVPLVAGPLGLTEEVALDATLFAAFDAVDNPRFKEGDWSSEFPELEDGSLNTALPALTMTGDASRPHELVVSLPALAVRMAQASYSDVAITLPAMTLSAGEGEGVHASLPKMTFVAAESQHYGALLCSLPPLQAQLLADDADEDVPYGVLAASLPRVTMAATIPAHFSAGMTLPRMTMRATWETTYSELAASLPPVRMLAYGDEQTPLVQVLEAIGCHVPLLPIAYVSLAFVERVDGSAAAVMSTVIGAQALEQISVQDQLSALQTFLTSAVEQIGLLERARLVAFDAQGEQGGEAWVVNTATNASTRYDHYGFNSFAAMGGRHYGARADGIYLLEGASDAGRPIKSGIALGRHDFGTQALKGIDAVYVGVSSTGALFLKVGDGRTHYTYRARRNDPRMKVQRFDVGRGLRTNYFTFELTSEADAFELDSVTFHVLASQRRI